MNKPLGLSLLAVVVLIVIIIVWPSQPSVLLYGEVEAEEYSLTSKALGRIDKLLVKKGQQVTKGEPVFRLTSPEATAKVAQAQAAFEAATATARNVADGARDEEIGIAKDALSQTRVAEQLATTTFNRIDALFRQGVVSRQRRDESLAAKQSATLARESAANALALLQSGARPNTQAAADANARVAKALVEEAAIFDNETTVVAPHSGQVSAILFKEGELAPPGLPAVRLIDNDDAWGIFQVREDQMPGIEVGTTLVVDIPALALTDMVFKVRYIAALGHYATWRTSSPGEGYDMRTFSIEAVPIEPVNNIRAGMTLLVTEINP